jgi:DNA-binding transcriptional ArsR family regulator
MRESACETVSEVIGVLSNPHRVRILCALAEGERSVREIAGEVGLPSSHVSAHLRVLYDRGHVERRREWKQVFYCLKDVRVRDLLDVAAALAGESLPGALERGRGSDFERR